MTEARTKYTITRCDHRSAVTVREWPSLGLCEMECTICRGTYFLLRVADGVSQEVTAEDAVRVITEAVRKAAERI